MSDLWDAMELWKLVRSENSDAKCFSLVMGRTRDWKTMGIRIRQLFCWMGRQVITVTFCYRPYFPKFYWSILTRAISPWNSGHIVPIVLIMVKRLLSLNAQVSKRQHTYALSEANDNHECWLTSSRTPSSESQNPTSPRLAGEATQDNHWLVGDITSVQDRHVEHSMLDALTMELLQHD